MSKSNKSVLRVLITGTNTTLDNGESAMASMAIKSLKQVFPNAHFVVGSTQKSIDSERWRRMLPAESMDITLVGAPSSARIPRTFRALLVILRYLPEFFMTDVCVDISGDGYSDATQYRLASSFTHSIQLLDGVMSRKPVVICAQSLGPFETKLTRFMARFVINKVSLVTVREEVSGNYLKSLGVNKPVVAVTGDFAFLLEPVSHEEARRLLSSENVNTGNHVLVGLVLSEIISKWAFPDVEDLNEKYILYVETMAKVADYLVDKLGATVILMPQCSGSYARHDDRVAMRRVYQKVKHQSSVVMINGDYVPGEIRGIIAECKLVVTAKMHAAIAAVSTYVPVVVLAYSFKTQGIFGKKLGLDDAIVDVREYNSKELLATLQEKIEYVWASRYRVIENLHVKIPLEREHALLNAKLVADTAKWN